MLRVIVGLMERIEKTKRQKKCDYENVDRKQPLIVNLYIFLKNVCPEIRLNVSASEILTNMERTMFKNIMRFIA